MATVDNVQKDGFSFTWTIQNISYCAETSLTSVPFMPSEDTKFCLVIYPKGTGGSDAIALYLKEVSTCEVLVDFELSICTPIGIFKQKLRKRFGQGWEFETSHGFIFSILLNDLHKKLPGININKDSLTVGCRIWKTSKQPVTFEQYHARTILVIDRTTYAWKMPNFLNEFKNKRPRKQPKFCLDNSSFTMEITSRGGAFTESNIVIEIKPMELVKCCLFSTCEMSLIGIDGKIVYSVRDEHRFEVSQNVQVWKLLFIPMDKLLCHKELYLPNGTLTLRCAFAISSGVTCSEVEEIENGIDNFNKLEFHKQENESDDPKSLKDNLKCFYTEGKFSDSTIRTQNKDYPVHKTILCARSEVFCAMFASDTKENKTGIIEIEDIDDDIISKMLLFLYTDNVGEHLEFETASSLYFAADKYRIVALKRKCADFLKGNFTVTNICNVLVLADMHQDKELKSAVQKFICEHSGEVMDSEEWTALIQNNIQLASETMRLVIRNFTA